MALSACDNDLKGQIQFSVIVSIVVMLIGTLKPLPYIAEKDFSNYEIIRISIALIVMGGCWLIWVFPRLFTRCVCVYLCERGLVYIDKNCVEYAIFWEEIETATGDTIVKKDGSIINIHRHIHRLSVTLSIMRHLQRLWAE